jgi:putative redox protein
MEIKVTHINQVKFAVQARNHEVICDQPVENGGEDAGMTPPEFLLASLGTCAAFYAVQYLRTRKLGGDGVEVTVTAEKVKPPARLTNFVIKVSAPVRLSPEHFEGLNRAVHACLVHNTLLHTPQISIELDVPEAVAI